MEGQAERKKNGVLACAWKMTRGTIMCQKVPLRDVPWNAGWPEGRSGHGGDEGDRTSETVRWNLVNYVRSFAKKAGGIAKQ
jgi:hypothetical protein